jgi:phosphatidylethanolamine-binding protein (PEBP) family uncharacterized protein
MAPGTSTLGWLIAAAASLALVVSGCGGGSSSSSGAASSSASAPTAPSSSAPVEAGQGAAGSQTGETEKKKHPPLDLPTGKPEEGPTRAEENNVPTVVIPLEVPAGLSSVNTCKGKDISPELTWGKVTSNAIELVVFAVNLQPVNGKLYFDWAMAGIDPSLEGLKPGEVPEGAILGRNSAGQSKYSLCPSNTKPETYAFSIYAIEKGTAPKEGFDPLAFRKLATRTSANGGIAAATYPAE